MDVPCTRLGLYAMLVPSLQPTDSPKVAIVMGIISYWWMVDFPENANQSFHFLSKQETELAVARIQKDRGDVELTPFSWRELLRHFLDPKIYGFAALFFLLVSPTDCCAETTTRQSDFARTLSRQPYRIFCRSCMALLLGREKSVLTMRQASKVVWASAQIKPYYYLLL